ncbi:hypothetical protein F0562_010893 [Nyssa sinensis]|uniref:AP2/ERF domain-containing protein n=1 Tax=Nyssa sinensis TaxID=561372 RepID=A0A5J5A1Y9_9ASTE|nr:hypothetical protein F0562_010893 [Nyssa sinensis]
MAARSHDVAALSIEANSAILNFPELARSLPQLVLLSSRDVQAAAAKATAMEKFDSSSSPSSSSLSSMVSAMELSTYDELSEIVELPIVKVLPLFNLSEPAASNVELKFLSFQSKSSFDYLSYPSLYVSLSSNDLFAHERLDL